MARSVLGRRKVSYALMNVAAWRRRPMRHWQMCDCREETLPEPTQTIVRGTTG